MYHSTYTARLRGALLAALVLPVLAFAQANPAGHGRADAAAPVATGGQEAHGATDQAAHIHTSAATGEAVASLALSWEGGADQAQAGAPAGLTVQAKDPQGMTDTVRAGTVLVLVQDDWARVTVGGAALAGVPAGSGQRFAMPLEGGSAHLAVTFAKAGRQRVLANLEADAEIAGESDPLWVQETVLTLQPPPGATQGTSARVTAVAQDRQGRPVSGYAGTLVLSTGDRAARVAAVPAAADSPDAGRGSAGRQVTAADAGRAQFDVTFAGSGSQTLEVRDVDAPMRRATLSMTVAPGADPTPRSTAATPSATSTATASATATGTPRGGTSTPTPTPSPTRTPCPRNGCATTTLTPVSASARTAAEMNAPALPFVFTGARLQSGTPSFAVTTSTAATNAGVQMQLTARALDAAGATDTAYRGQIKLTSTDAAFSPGTAYRYTFTAADAGQHAFTVTFNTAGGAQTISVTDTTTAAMTGASPAVAVAETILQATFAAGTAVQGVGKNLTVQAKDSGGNLVTGYTGRVKLTASYDGVQWNQWGAGVDTAPSYTFTGADAGQHSFAPKFKYAGDQTATVTDMALAARTVTTAALTVTNSAPGSFSHESTPSGVKLADGSMVAAYLGIRGRLYVRRNVGTNAEPAWRPLVTVREPAGGNIGTDSPSLVRFGGTLALFHAFTDGTYYQVWLTTSADDGATWSAPVKITSEAGHVQRVHAVVSGGTLYLFWSRQDTDGRLWYQTTTDLSTWTAKVMAGQAIGAPIANTTPNFGITRLASGQWLLGWLAPTPVDEGVTGVANSFGYPTVHVATSADLATWSGAVELHLPRSQAGAESVALAQDPSTGLVWAAFEQHKDNRDDYIVARSSTDGMSWAAQVTVGYEHALPTDGNQFFSGKMPALIPGSMTTMYSATRSATTNGYGLACWAFADMGRATGTGEPANPTGEYPPVPVTDDPRAPDCATGGCNQRGGPVNVLTGYLWTAATDLAVPVRGTALAVTRTYNSYDGIAAADGPFGYGWSWAYGARALTRADESVTVVEPNGRRAHFWKSGAGWTAAPHLNATLAVGAGGGYTLTRHDQTVWSFDAAGKLTAVADRNGAGVTLSYSGAALTTVAGAGGRSLTITTNASGRVSRIDGPGGLASSYTYDATGHLLTATDAAGATTTYTYDSRHQLLTVVDGTGHITEANTYGVLGRVLEQRDAATQLTTFAYRAEVGVNGSDPNSGTDVTDPRGIKTTYAFDQGWRLTRRTVYEGITQRARVNWSYDAAGNLTSVQVVPVSGATRTTTSTSDARGNVLTVVADAGASPALNLTSTFTYSAANDVLTATDPLGHTTTYTYDSRGNRLTATDPLGHTTTSTYDPTTGELLTVTDATGRTVSFGYSTAGDLTTVTVPGGAVWTLGYDAAGRLTAGTDPLGHTTTVTHDGLGRVLTATNALGQTTTVTYDAAGNRRRVTDALGRQTSYAYDVLDRLTRVTDALGGVTSYGYDPNGNLTSVTDALGTGHTWSYTADALNRLTTATDPLGQTRTSSYDAYGNVGQLQKPDGTGNRFTYDRANRLTGIDLANDGSLDIQYAYDGASRRTAMIDGTGTTTYAYDNADRLTSVTAPGTGTVAYGYDSANRRTTLTYPSAHQVSYGYTTRGELQSVTDWTGGTTTYGYDAAGRLTGMALANGVSSTLGYDLADRLTSIVHAKGGMTLEAITYALNAVGNRTSMVDSAGTTTWAYDALDRLTSATYPTGDVVGYGYDAVGNRTTHTVNGAVTTSTFDAANRLTAAGTTTYAYDPNGNQTSKTAGGVTTSYSYDALDRLSGITGPVTASYSYTGDGLRVGKTVGGVTTRYTWDVLGLPVVLSDGNAYLWGAGLIGQITGAGATTFAHADGVGSVRLLTDAAGTVVGTQQYDAFGAVRGQTGTQLPFGYTGEHVDAESALVYLRARYLDPGSGRFLTQDHDPGEVTLPATQQGYSYVLNNPLRWIDRTGAKPMEPGSWDPCADLAQEIEDLVEDLAFRYDDMRRDRHDLYRKHRSYRNAHPDYGCWEGHKDKYEAVRDELNDKLEEWADKGCGGKGPGLPAGARDWARRPAPERPDHRWRWSDFPMPFPIL